MRKKPARDSLLGNVESQCLGGFHTNPGFIKAQKAAERVFIMRHFYNESHWRFNRKKSFSLV